MNNQPNNFFDSRTLLALSLTFLAWLGWQWHLQKKYPQPVSPGTMAKNSAVNSTDHPSPDVVVNPEPSFNKNHGENAEGVQNFKSSAENGSVEKTFWIEDENWKFLLSSHGMGMRDFELKKFTGRDGDFIRIGSEQQGHLPLETQLVGLSQPLFFDIQKVSETRYVGKAKYNAIEIIKSMDLDSSLHRLDFQVTIKGNLELHKGVVTYLADTLKKTSKGNFLSPQQETQEVYLSSSDTTERKHLNPEQDELFTLNQLKVAALGGQYFTQAVVDSSDILPEIKVRSLAQASSLLGSLTYQFVPGQAGLTLKYTAVVGPKDLQRLKQVDENLVGIVDFGFFSSLGRPILKMLKWFYAVSGNWGIAIILLTLLVRLLVLPFNVMSFRSMKAMQKVQPQMQTIREKFKDNKERQNQEMMLLFKENKINPLGGCLPILLQIPIFFALYQVLGHSIELYKAPFMLWIHDLSHKDPYFVLPILMGITMFIQQKLTPTSMDPAQARILMFMPIIFSVFMLTLPSGLTLYIFVSTLFGIGQQLYLLKGSQTLHSSNSQK